jgi:hypothetical protein
MASQPLTIVPPSATILRSAFFLMGLPLPDASYDA